MKNLTIRKSTISKLNSNTAINSAMTTTWGTRMAMTTTWGTRA